MTDRTQLMAEQVARTLTHFVDKTTGTGIGRVPEAAMARVLMREAAKVATAAGMVHSDALAKFQAELASFDLPVRTVDEAAAGPAEDAVLEEPAAPAEAETEVERIAPASAGAESVPAAVDEVMGSSDAADEP